MTSSIDFPLSPSVVTPPRAASNAVIDIGAPLVAWLIEHALPLWSRVGIDRRGGGYFEKIDLNGSPLSEPRRARVVTRQIYVFATAARHGWLPDADVWVEHGLRFLLERMRLPGGMYAAAVWPDGSVVRGGFDLYEHAFVLFALAAARRGRPDREPLRREAEGLLRRMRKHWAHPIAGFEEAMPRTLPLNSNPHMHLVEAALEWVEISEGPDREIWLTLADEIVELCLTHFIDAESGALREHFGGNWQPMPGTLGCIVEPGHQFEWAWLLMRWSRLRNREDARLAALRLMDVGEMHGVDRFRGVAVNTLSTSGTSDKGLYVMDAAAKLWPQTERIKAWHAAASHGDARHVSVARQSLAHAIEGLSRFLLLSPIGLWREQMNADGTFFVEPSRASSLYHIVCAIDTLQGHAQEPHLSPPSLSVLSSGVMQ